MKYKLYTSNNNNNNISAKYTAIRKKIPRYKLLISNYQK